MTTTLALAPGPDATATTDPADTIAPSPPPPGPARARTGFSFRSGEIEDAGQILALVEEHLASGRLLPRTPEDLAEHADRFVVIEHAGRVVGCAELAPLSPAVAEVRTLVVDAAWRARGLGTSLVTHVWQRARLAGFATLCAFTHEPSHFVRLGFSIAPHTRFPEKLALDCVGCRRFRSCGQVAVALQLDGRALDDPRGRSSRAPERPGTSNTTPLARPHARAHAGSAR